MFFLISLTKQKKIYEKIKKINKQLKKPKIKLEWKSHPLFSKKINDFDSSSSEDEN